MGSIPPDPLPFLGEQDIYLFNEGNHFRLYEKLGAHPGIEKGITGTHFAVWAPNAQCVSVIGDFNGWDTEAAPLEPVGASGLWAGFLPGIGPGATYKYHILSRHQGYSVDKADPFAFTSEVPPLTASRVWDLDYAWGDQAWMASRKERNALDAPWSIYEVHLGSFIRNGPEGEPGLGYREIAERLTEHVSGLGFTHVELLPVMEHPFYGSWGYQPLGFFAPTSRYGSPQDFMALVDHLHQHGIGVILDWVPSHFPSDEHGLGYFDGTHLYEHQDPKQGIHPEWKSLVFNHGRHEVRAFLINSALFWLDRYHVDGLRVDAVASMLYLDYGREKGDWIPNPHGGRENLDAITFLQTLNQEIYTRFPDVQTIAEESTAWPLVSRPPYLGGLGFGMKWDMGWMHDTLSYMSKDPVHRRFHHDKLTFRIIYAFHENFVLALSHDEVVYGKGSLLQKMPGDTWQQFANLRLLFAYLYAQPGKKLLFMGGEFGQWKEWDHEVSLDWDLLQQPFHKGVQTWVADLNRVYREEPALFAEDFSQEGFHWIDCNDSQHSVVTLLRKAGQDRRPVVAVFNFTPVPRIRYRIGVPLEGFWKEILNSDGETYQGSGLGNFGGSFSEEIPFHGQPYSLALTLPPLGALFLIPRLTRGQAHGR